MPARSAGRPIEQGRPSSPLPADEASVWRALHLSERLLGRPADRLRSPEPQAEPKAAESAPVRAGRLAAPFRLIDVDLRNRLLSSQVTVARAALT